jgi:hypothetical protein
MVCLWACSSVWLERSADNRKVESSNLSRPTFQFTRPTFLVLLVNHLRLRKSMISSGVVQTYSKPFSISCRASSLSLVAFEV